MTNGCPARTTTARSTIRWIKQGYDCGVRERRAHDGRPDTSGGAAAGPGHLAHEHVLGQQKAPGRTAGTVRQIDTTDAHPRPPGSRGAPLAELSEAVHRSIAQLGDRIDGDATLHSWEESLNAPPWDGEEVWVHGDLLPGNLLVVDGRLSAVIDFGGLNVGDPSCDLQPAWNVFAGDSRARYRAQLQGRQCVMVTRPRLGSRSGCGGAALLLEHQPRHDSPGLTRACASPRRRIALSGSHPPPGRGLIRPGRHGGESKRDGARSPWLAAGEPDLAPRSRGGGTRTPGLRFWRPPLYQLSYAPGLAGL